MSAYSPLPSTGRSFQLATIGAPFQEYILPNRPSHNRLVNILTLGSTTRVQAKHSLLRDGFLRTLRCTGSLARFFYLHIAASVRIARSCRGLTGDTEGPPVPRVLPVLRYVATDHPDRRGP